jgi:tripartite-type tricarboxylate transporter receptor subunit TctC
MSSFLKFLKPALALAFALLAAPMASADDFYRGKTITMVVGYAPGGGIDTSARILARHLVRFIPGSPNIVIQTVEGAAGVIAANYLDKRASADGLTIGVPGRSWFIEGVIRNPNAQFDPVRMGYVGSTGTMNSLLWVMANSTITTLDAFMKSPQPVVFGALGAGTPTAMVAAMLVQSGAPIKLVTGYPGSSRLLIAMQQGELQAVFLTEDSFSLHKDLIEKKIMIPILQSRPVQPGVPLVTEVVQPRFHPLLALAQSGETLGMMVVTPPGVPDDRMDILRKAFMAMARDPEYRAEVAKFDTTRTEPLDGARVAEMMRDLVAASTPDVIEAFKRLKQ